MENLDKEIERIMQSFDEEYLMGIEDLELECEEINELSFDEVA
jgi:hypothetical protein